MLAEADTIGSGEMIRFLLVRFQRRRFGDETGVLSEGLGL